MFSFVKWRPTAMGLAVAAVLLYLTPHARADFVLSLSDGTGDSITADETTSTFTTTGQVAGLGGYGSPGVAFAPGVISIDAALGGFTLNVSTAEGYPAIGNPDSAVLDLNNTSVSSSRGGTLTITAYQTGDSVVPGYPTGFLSSSIGGTLSGATLSAQSWYDPSNTGITNGSIPNGSVAIYSSPG
ncbi:MAG: hypothetical protein ACRELG_26420, partial [Gemmataceae bacterium]